MAVLRSDVAKPANAPPARGRRRRVPAGGAYGGYGIPRGWNRRDPAIIGGRADDAERTFARGRLSSPGFTGHQTFPMRHGWLKKAYDAVAATEAGGANKWVFPSDDVIAPFGVGRNMVVSIRHWAAAAGVIDEPPGSDAVATTEFGRRIFGADGFDPYMEHPASSWLVHWNLAANPAFTTWFWTFGHYAGGGFGRSDLVEGIARMARNREWRKASAATLKSDVACLILTYAGRNAAAGADNDGMLESPLADLGLIKSTGSRDGYRMVRGAKGTLGDEVFAYALLDFWARRMPESATMSFDAVAHGPGSPGRVFLLGEDDIVDRLAGLEESMGRAVRWSETAGLKQLVRGPGFDFGAGLDLIRPGRKVRGGRGNAPSAQAADLRPLPLFAAAG